MMHLVSGRVNLAQVREAARRELLNCIDKCPGSKVSNEFCDMRSYRVSKKICYNPSHTNKSQDPSLVLF